MKELLERCAGLDVHQKSVVACIMIGLGDDMRKEVKTFGTMTDDLNDLKAWLKANQIRHIVLESTGVYWKPIFNILEDETFDISLANARNVKNVPGRKTDVKDSIWLCRLLKSGLIEKSFIPPESIRHLRDLTRYRKSEKQALVSEKNRLIKVLESANIKISSVFTDVYGKTAWNMILALADGVTNLDELVAHVPGQVKATKKDIKKALKGTLKQHHLNLLKLMINQIIELEKVIDNIEELIKEALIPYSQEVDLLKTIPGVSDTVASVIVAEIGIDMDQFPSASHLASWAGVAPGNNESAGKKKALE